MANIFLNGADRDIETAIMLEQAIVHDIGNAVAFTDGDRIFINTDDNLFNILPAYDHKMLKWLLWHERYHKELRHHNRYFKYLKELEKVGETRFGVTKEEVNIIMDILVHDSLAKLFPDLIETAVNNLAQMRNRNSLGYTFKSYTLEEMLNEYKAHKKEEDNGDGDGDGKGTDDDTDEDTKKGGKPGDDKKDDEDSEEGEAEGKEKGHEDGGKSEGSDKDKDRPEDGKPEIKDGETKPEEKHSETDWSKLDKIDTKEFIDQEESDRYMHKINELRLKKFRLGRLTETLNGLTTTTRRRTYSMPSTIQAGSGTLLKGSTPGKTLLYLCFDASGSMGAELHTFKDIISKSIPQAMESPCEWFAGYGAKIRAYKVDRDDGYYKGKFKDIMCVGASSGYSDDGDRVIELCHKAEQAGYSPIGITDGGGQISWSKSMLKQLKRTILVGQNKDWLNEAKKINPKIQTLDI